MKKIRLGDLVLEENIIDENTLKKVRQEQQQTGKKLGQVLQDMGLIEEEQLLKLLSRQLDLPYVDLRRFDLEKNIIGKLPEKYARRYRAIVLSQTDDGYQVGFIDPLDITAVDMIHKILKDKVHPVVVNETALLKKFDKAYEEKSTDENIRS
tara:strand:- start:329 stop:784 length:456 start_codon:yes stop_codon:yes gene_type:complete